MKKTLVPNKNVVDKNYVANAVCTYTVLLMRALEKGDFKVAEIMIKGLLRHGVEFHFYPNETGAVKCHLDRKPTARSKSRKRRKTA